LLSSFRVLSPFLLWVSFSRRYFISQKWHNSVWRGAGGPLESHILQHLGPAQVLRGEKNKSRTSNIGSKMTSIFL
jgi:hypothetical protein